MRTFGDDPVRVRAATAAAKLALAAAASSEEAAAAGHNAAWQTWATQLVGNDPVRVEAAITAAKQAQEDGTDRQQIEKSARAAADRALSASWQVWATAAFPDDHPKAITAARAALAAAHAGAGSDDAASAGRQAAELTAFQTAPQPRNSPAAATRSWRETAVPDDVEGDPARIEPQPRQAEGTSHASRVRAIVLVAASWLVFVVVLRVDQLHYVSNDYGTYMSLWSVGNGTAPTVTHFPFWLLTCGATLVLALSLIGLPGYRRLILIGAFAAALLLIGYSLILLTGTYNPDYGFHHYGFGFYVSLVAAAAMVITTGVVAFRSIRLREREW